MTTTPPDPQRPQQPQLPDQPANLASAVHTRRERRARWLREGERSIGQNLAMIGVLGWTIVTPALLGILVGRWLDRTLRSGIFWTFGLLVLGLGGGCWLAWKRIQRA